jgi:dipeptidase E
MDKSLLLISGSYTYGTGYLDHCEPQIRKVLSEVDQVLFIPYAMPDLISHDDYTKLARNRFERMGLVLKGIHETKSPQKAILSAESIFAAGGNTFLLLHSLYQNGLIEVIRQRVREGIPYIGTSAGSNIAGLTIGTTNDMPIVYPPSIMALRLVPFNINPHYIDPDSNSKHQGETRERRIKEFHGFNAQPVVGLREGSMLRVDDNHIYLEGVAGARIFRRGQQPTEHEPGELLDFLLFDNSNNSLI